MSNCVTARPKGITGTGLKVFAAVCMLCDHIHSFFGYTGWIPEWFSMVGRLAAPIFLFCLVEGFCHTHDRRRYFLKILGIAVPMGLLLFFMRYAGFLVRPDGFYPQNSMMSTFVLLLGFFQALSMLGSRNPKRMLAGGALLLFLLSWPFLASWCTVRFPASATILGVLGYTVLPMVNLTGDLGLPLLITGIALYLTRKHRVVQAITLALCYFGWYFVLIYLQVRGLPGFSFVQMFTTYYEWIGGVLAAPLLLWYNGERGAGYGKFFYLFYPAHIYGLYALSWLLMPVLRLN